MSALADSRHFDIAVVHLQRGMVLRQTQFADWGKLRGSWRQVQPQSLQMCIECILFVHSKRGLAVVCSEVVS